VIAEPAAPYPHPRRAPRPRGFADWRARLDRERVAPVIAIAGSKGKTSILRAVESIFRTGGYRFASWTDRGVEIEGEHQRGELGPWSRALTRLAAGGLDIALQELDWATIPTAGVPGASHPIVAVANLCANSETCYFTPETAQAQRALRLIKSSIAPAGRLVLNADDFAVAEENEGVEGLERRYLVGISADAPVLRRHVLAGGDACWLENGSITIRESGLTRAIADVRRLPLTREGTIPFAVQNALIATAIARSCGIPERLIAAGLAAHEARPESMPGSFNVFDLGSATIVVDRPMPSWFLRTSLRASANLGSGRQVRVVGPMREVSTEDLSEVGRLLGRNGGVLIAHSGWPPERLEHFRHGAAGNTVPPIFLQAPDERTAVKQALNMLRAKDVMLILAENPPATISLIQRHLRRLAANTCNAANVAQAS
jgi:cyanophycin synthetase